VNEQYAKHQPKYVINPINVLGNNLFPSAKASGFGQSYFDPYDLSSNKQQFSTAESMAETTPRLSDTAVQLLTAERHYLNSLPEAPKYCGQVNWNLKDYHSNPVEISSIFWSLDTTDWWRVQQETHWKYPNLSNVARDIFSIIPHCVGVESSSSLRQDIVGWRQSKTTSEILQEEAVVTLFAKANNRMLPVDHTVLDNTETKNDVELNKEVEERKSHRRAKVHDFLEMW